MIATYCLHHGVVPGPTCHPCAQARAKRRNQQPHRKAHHTTKHYTLRRKVFARDKGCVYCGSQENPTLDYVTPLQDGGAQDMSNAVQACRSCNSSKGRRAA